MRDYWLTQYLLAAVGWGYIALTLFGLALALWIPKRKVSKLIAGAVVLGLAGVLPVRGYRDYQKQSEAIGEFAVRQAKARALFEERCKSAGVKITRTVEGVEGIRLARVRTGNVAAERANPRWPDAGLPDEPTGTDYVMTFLLWENHEDKRTQRGYLTSNRTSAPGYRYVDAKTSEGSWTRYELGPQGELTNRLVSERELARYEVSHASIGPAEDREQWVAGVAIAVVDTKTGETLAKRESYAFEPGLGSTAGFRSPWGFAVTCPAHYGWDGGRTRFFVDRVLKPVVSN